MPPERQLNCPLKYISEGNFMRLNINDHGRKYGYKFTKRGSATSFRGWRFRLRIVSERPQASGCSEIWAHISEEGGLVDTGCEQRGKTKHGSEVIDEAIVAVREEATEENLVNFLKLSHGYNSFREGQLKTIKLVLAGESMMLVLPTGARKSLCYQLPILVLPGLTLVVSPLVALMVDQLRQLPLVIPGGLLPSSQTIEEASITLRRLHEGNIKVLFVSPERFLNSEFISILLLIRRVPGRRRVLIIVEQVEPKGVEDKVGELPQLPNNTLVGKSSTMNYPEESEWDVFGNDLYVTPEVIPAIPSHTTVDVAAVSNVDEDNKIKELIDGSALDWNRPMQDAYGTGRGFGRGDMGGRMMGGRGRGFGFGRGGRLQGNTPPPGYIHHRCKVPGHFIQLCPTNGDPNFDIRRVKPPTGIPRSMLMATPDGSYALPNGVVAVLKPNEVAFEKEIEGLPTTRSVSDLPQELHCPLCKDAMKDVVLTSKYCFRTFCYKCIQDYIVTKSSCVCGVTNVLADDLVPNYTLRETISRLLDATTSSTENGGSFVQVQDMESARQGQPKVPSPTISATSKDEARQPPSKEYSLDTKEVERTSGGNLVNTLTISLDKKAGQNVDPSEATPESVSAKEAISPEGAPAPEGGQEKLLAGDQGKKKKKKKTRVPVGAADMQWGAYQDFGTENFSGMPLGPSAFNPYWTGGMPMGMDGYMAPFGGGMPFMGYPPGPFDVPYGGMLSQDPFAQQGYNMMHPGIPQRDLSELGTGNMGINQGRPVMSREEFEARKADVRRKREMERLGGERDHSRDRGREVDRGDRGRETDRGDRGREVGSSLDVSSMKAKPRLMSQATPVDRTDRSDRAEKDRPAPSRLLSPRAKKRRASDQDDTTAATAAAVAADKKQKGSVFSRISFPESGSKKSKTEPSNGLKDKQKERETSVVGHRPATNGHRDDSKAGKGTAASSEGRRGRGHDHESSEEEYHFKRRPSSRREAEDEGRGKKERGEHGHSHDRPKRR